MTREAKIWKCIDCNVVVNRNVKRCAGCNDTFRNNGPRQASSLHLNREWLHQKYVAEGLSTYDIAKLVDRDSKNIYQKLVDFGIPTRSRGENLKGEDCYMKQEGAVHPMKGKPRSEEHRRNIGIKSSVPKPNLRGERNGMFGKFGQENPGFVDGSSPERQRLYSQGAFKEIVRAVYLRDNYKCVRCGGDSNGKRSLHAHHLKTWAANPELRFDMANLITLCRTCHEWVHSNNNITGEYLP